MVFSKKVSIPFSKYASDFYPNPPKPGANIFGDAYITNDYLIVKVGYISPNRMENKPKNYSFYILDFDLNILGTIMLKHDVNPYFDKNFEFLYYIIDNTLFVYKIQIN